MSDTFLRIEVLGASPIPSTRIVKPVDRFGPIIKVPYTKATVIARLRPLLRKIRQKENNEQCLFFRTGSTFLAI